MLPARSIRVNWSAQPCPTRYAYVLPATSTACHLFLLCLTQPATSFQSPLLSRKPSVIVLGASLCFTFLRQHQYVLAFIPFIICFSLSYLTNRRWKCCIALRSTQLRTIVNGAQCYATWLKNLGFVKTAPYFCRAITIADRKPMGIELPKLAIAATYLWGQGCPTATSKAWEGNAMGTLAPASSSPLSPIIPNAPAVVEWSDIASRPRAPHYLADPHPSSVQLNLLFNEEQNTVSFKIRVWLYFEQPSGGERKEYVYIRVHPENVHLLLPDATHHLPEGIAAAVRGPTAYFHLVLNKPVSILAPFDAPVPLRSERSSQLLDSLEELSRQTVLGIHIGQHIISDPDVVRRICDAFTSGSIKQHPRHDSLRDFYRGRGARVVQQLVGSAVSGSEKPGMRTEEHGADGHPASPPPYPEPLDLPPPSLFAQHSRKKRQRVCAELFAQQKAQTTEFVLWQQAQMSKFVEQQQAQTHHILGRMDHAVQCMESRIIGRVEKHLRDESDKTDDQDSKRQEWGQLIQNLVEKSIVNLELQLEASLEANLERGREDLKCELKNECLDELKDDLQEGLVTGVVAKSEPD
ncbi:hypothetical protein J7T55_011010 [Diaporthe amygdali]|uniref:uncharacterized protein n=1 Tax=Phomopsis amygdali TaxID=1214568 RepID=UPI0022FF3142|nr:uncharacterized protein J7T55_011010 [Diaporthe amygdali]KAJ0103740.1 hypothetical protein J7T55_011010 [Diaporthe amygdali]